MDRCELLMKQPSKKSMLLIGKKNLQKFFQNEVLMRLLEIRRILKYKNYKATIQ